jgi:hypothetical protein
MVRGAEIAAEYEAVPSPQWVKDRSAVVWFAGVMERLFKLSG